MQKDMNDFWLIADFLRKIVTERIFCFCYEKEQVLKICRKQNSANKKHAVLPGVSLFFIGKSFLSSFLLAFCKS